MGAGWCAPCESQKLMSGARITTSLGDSIPGAGVSTGSGAELAGTSSRVGLAGVPNITFPDWPIEITPHAPPSPSAAGQHHDRYDQRIGTHCRLKVIRTPFVN